jgi:hypothetical protein
MENSMVPAHQQEILKGFFVGVNFTRFILLYTASRDGLGAKDFHSHVLGKNQLVVLIKSENVYIFGGLTSSASFNELYGVFIHSENTLFLLFQILQINQQNLNVLNLNIVFITKVLVVLVLVTTKIFIYVIILI